MAEPVGAAPAQETSEKPKPRLGAWLSLGAGAAVAITGGVLLGVAVSDQNKVEGAEDGSAWKDYEGAYERAKPLSIAGAVALGAGAVGLGIGTWLLLRSGDSSEPGAANARLELLPNGLRMRGTW